MDRASAAHLSSTALSGARINADNLRKNGISLDALGRWDPDKRRIALEWHGPFHGDPTIGYRYFADLRDETWNLQNNYRGERS